MNLQPPLPFASPIYVKYDDIYITAITLYAKYFKTVKICFIIRSKTFYNVHLLYKINVVYRLYFCKLSEIVS